MDLAAKLAERLLGGAQPGSAMGVACTVVAVAVALLLPLLVPLLLPRRLRESKPQRRETRGRDAVDAFDAVGAAELARAEAFARRCSAGAYGHGEGTPGYQFPDEELRRRLGARAYCDAAGAVPYGTLTQCASIMSRYRCLGSLAPFQGFGLGPMTPSIDHRGVFKIPKTIATILQFVRGGGDQVRLYASWLTTSIYCLAFPQRRPPYAARQRRCSASRRRLAATRTAAAAVVAATVLRTHELRRRCCATWAARAPRTAPSGRLSGRLAPPRRCGWHPRHYPGRRAR